VVKKNPERTVRFRFAGWRGGCLPHWRALLYMLMSFGSAPRALHCRDPMYHMLKYGPLTKNYLENSSNYWSQPTKTTPERTVRAARETLGEGGVAPPGGGAL